MNVAVRGLVTIVASLTILSACGNSDSKDKEENTPSPVKSSSSSATPLHAPPADVAPFNATVYISDDFPEEQWLPTQFAPKLVADQSVSQFDKWPLESDTVRVLCQIEGETVQDGTGNQITLWYGIQVPTKEAAPEAHDQQGVEAEAVEGGYLGFVNASALRDAGATAPACED